MIQITQGTYAGIGTKCVESEIYYEKYTQKNNNNHLSSLVLSLNTLGEPSIRPTWEWIKNSFRCCYFQKLIDQQVPTFASATKKKNYCGDAITTHFLVYKNACS